MKPNYIVIPAITLIVALSGSWLTNLGMGWYKTLILPKLAPPGYAIGIIWTLIFILSTISALLVWNKSIRDRRLFSTLIILFIINAALNVFWSYIFFYSHLFLSAIIEMIILDITVVALIIYIRPVSKIASWLLVPYAVWVAFATILASQIWILN